MTSESGNLPARQTQIDRWDPGLTRHVVDLLLSLGSFERYSAECENRSPADAALHRYLQRVAGSARALFEDALVLVARSEGLALQGGDYVVLSGRGRDEHSP